MDAQGVRLLAARLRPSLLAVAALGGVLTRLLRFDIAAAHRAARTLFEGIDGAVELVGHLAAGGRLAEPFRPFLRGGADVLCALLLALPLTFCSELAKEDDSGNDHY